MDRKPCFLTKKGPARAFPLAQLPLDTPPSLPSDLEVAVCSPDFFSFLFPEAPALLLPCGWALGLAGPSTASPPDPLLSSPLLSSPPGAVYSICSVPPPHPLSPLSDSPPGSQHLCVEI